MEIILNEIKGVQVISISGDLHSGMELDLEMKISEFLGKDRIPKIVIDFSSVEHMNSSILTVLIKAHNLIEESHGNFSICGINASIEKLLTLTKINNVLEIFKNQSEALESLGN